MSLSKRFPVVAVLILLPMLTSGIPAEGRKGSDSIPAEDIPPPVTSPWRVGDFDLPPEQVLGALLDLIRQDGLTLPESEYGKGIFRTDLIDFDEAKFGKANVALPPPVPTPKYPYFGLNDMTFGRFGLEGMIRERSAGHTRLQLRALLEAPAFYAKMKTKAWVPRVSNGFIESYCFARLRQRLDSADFPSSSPPEEPPGDP